MLILTRRLLFSISFLFISFFSILTPITLASDIDFTPSVPIPGGLSGKLESTSIAQYIQAIYKYSVGVGAIIATVILMFGGIRWITAAGNASAIDDAKGWIMASLTGLILLLFTYTILYLVNPEIVAFKEIKLKEVKEQPYSAVDKMTCRPVPSCNITCANDECCIAPVMGGSGYTCTKKVETTSSILAGNCKGLTGFELAVCNENGGKTNSCDQYSSGTFKRAQCEGTLKEYCSKHAFGEAIARCEEGVPVECITADDCPGDEWCAGSKCFSCMETGSECQKVYGNICNNCCNATSDTSSVCS